MSAQDDTSQDAVVGRYRSSMDPEGVFLRSGNRLVAMREAPYDTEAVLQEALARFPEVLAGPTTSGSSGVLLLIKREAAIPTADHGAAAFALDHLFIDADAVPVLVEVKRSSDTRIRREVIGQMLDYAANATSYWSLSSLKESLESTAAEAGRSMDEAIADLWSGEPDDFWHAVEANLRAGRVRLVFVADSLPDELVRVIEFLNSQMSPAEVLGVELHQYVGDDQVVYVPRVVGRTTAAAAKKEVGGGRVWDLESFLAAADERCSPPEVALIRRLLDHAEERGVRVTWGRGATPGVSGWYQLGARPTATWVLNLNDARSTTRAYLTFYLADVSRHAPDDRVPLAADALERIPPVAPKIAAARESEWRKYPSVYLQDVAGQEELTSAIFVALDVLAGPTVASNR